MRHIVFILLLASTLNVFSQAAPKNIIVVVANGVGHNHTKALDIYNGNQSVWNTFPVQYGVITYPAYSNTITVPKEVQYYTGDYHTRRVWSEFAYADNMVTDAASAGTAMATGIKSAYKAVGVDLDSSERETILERAFLLGKSTGIITDMAFSQSAVSSFAAHNPSCDNATEIFSQLLASNVSLMIGCGNPLYTNNGDSKDTPDYTFILEQDWNALINNNNGTPDAWSLLQTKDDLLTAANRPLFIPQTFDAVQFKRSQEHTITTVPTLHELSEYGIHHLAANTQGFALVIETGAVEYASALQNKTTMIQAMEELELTVATITNWIENNSSWDETLLIVTGSYETGFLTSLEFDATQKNPDYYTKTYSLTTGAQGSVPDMVFQSTHNTKFPTPLFAKGIGSNLFSEYIDQEDFVFGHVINNYEIGQVCMRLLPDPAKAYKTPKNIIFMINDGAGLNQIRAAEYYTGVRQAYRDFPVALFHSTYPLTTNENVHLVQHWNNSYESRLAWLDPTYLRERNNATCSGASATAMASGTKTYYYSMGVDKDGNALNTIARHAKLLQKSNGLIVTKAIYDATPAGFYTNNKSRNNYSEITRQIIIESKADILIGADHPEFDVNGQAVENPDYTNMGGVEFWEDLVAEKTVFRTAANSGATEVQDSDGDGIPDAWTFIQDSVDFAQLLEAPTTPTRILGIIKSAFSTQSYRTGINRQEVHFDDLNPEIPDLWQTSLLGLKHLNKNPEGFFIMIEGSATDNAGHNKEKGRIIEEQMRFDQAVDSVIAWIEAHGGWDENLLIITADHETGLLASPTLNTDSITLNHYDIIDNGAGNMPGMEFYATHHSNQLIPFFAKGAGSEIYYEYADEHDAVFGKFLTNSEIAQGMFRLWNGKPCTIINHRPILVSSNPIPDVWLSLGVDTSFTIEKNFISDVEDTEFLYTVGARPRWIQVDAETLTFSGTPTSTGRSNVVINVTDGKTTGAGLTTQVSFAIITLDNGTSIDAVQTAEAYVYPNPTSTTLIASIPSGSAQVVIYNQNGKIVFNTYSNTSEMRIPVADMIPGTYIIQIQEKEITTQHTVIIQ